MLQAKLKRLENRAELNRANMVLVYLSRNWNREERSLQNILTLLYTGGIKIPILKLTKLSLTALRKNSSNRNLTPTQIKKKISRKYSITQESHILTS